MTFIANPGARIMATTKQDLVDRIADSTHTKRALVKTVVQQFFDEIISELGHWAHPVVCGGRLYIRHSEKLFAYDLREN